MTPIIGIMASQISGHLWEPQGAYDALSTVTVPSGGLASITFAAIPQGYKHLQLRGIALSSSAGAVVYANYNNDTGANYARHRLVGYGGTDAFGATGQTTFSILGDFTGTGATPISSAIIVDILDYANTSKNTTSRILSGVDRNGSGEVALISSLWNNTAAISSITLTIGGSVSTFAQHSQFTLYGVR